MTTLQLRSAVLLAVPMPRHVTGMLVVSGLIVVPVWKKNKKSVCRRLRLYLAGSMFLFVYSDNAIRLH